MTRAYTQAQRQLLEAADAFYYAGVLTSLPFDAPNVDCQSRTTEVAQAADAAVHGKNNKNSLGAPPIVNLGFSIELYIKLLWQLADGSDLYGRNLYCLFISLDKKHPKIGSAIVNAHHYARGDRDDFLEFISEVKSVFEDWRYVHEKEFLMTSPDTLFVMARTFHDVVGQLHPDLPSAFRS